MTLGQLADILHGEIIDKYRNLKFKAVDIDSRKIKKGQLFIPLKGENVDGHKFIEDVLKLGAYSLSEKEIAGPVIKVKNTEKALQDMAKYYAEKINPFTIAISGSNGKTSVKDITASILSQFGKTHKTQGNFNNHLGLPLTILNMDKNTKYAVIEMGISNFGDMDLLSKIIKPDIGLITNATEAHLDDLVNRENIAKAKMEMIANFKADGPFIYCIDDDVLEEMAKAVKINKISYGTKANADYRITNIKLGENTSSFKINQEEFEINLIGSHQILNATGAIVIALEMGLDLEKIKKGLIKAEITGMRNELKKAGDFTILDDSYKSNPSSLKMALDTMYNLEGYSQKIVILGDMLGIGDEVETYHREIGKIINEDEIDIIIGIGYYSEYIIWEAEDRFGSERLYHFEEKPKDIAEIKKLIKPNSLILVKASRPLELDTIVKDLLEE